MKRSNSTRSTSSRPVTPNADNNAARSAAAAAAAALATAQRRNSIETNTSRPVEAGLQRRGSVSSIRSSLSATPGHYSAVRQTGSRRLYGQPAVTTNATIAATSAASHVRPPTPAATGHRLQNTLRSKPPPVKLQVKRQGISSNASIRSFQSDLERINEDYNKTYTYAGQTSASAMKSAPVGVRARRADSIASSVVSDVSDLNDQSLAARKKASRVSFSDVESETRSRAPSPAPRKSAMKSSNNLGRGTSPAGPVTLQRRLSNSSLRSNGSLVPEAPTMSPLVKQTQTIPTITREEEEGELSQIVDESAFVDAEEDFQMSPALARTGILLNNAPLTQQNLAQASQSNGSPLRSAMKQTAQNGRSARLPADSDLDAADDESDDSFTARRRAKKNKKALSSILGEKVTPSAEIDNESINAMPMPPHRPASRAGSIRSTTSQEPRRMVSLRDRPESRGRRQSVQPARTPSYEAPVLSRRLSVQSLRSNQPPIPIKSTRRGSVTGSVAESVRSEAVNSHLAVMERAQANVQRLLHGDNAPDTVADAPERRSSFERKRMGGLTRRMSNSSMSGRVSGMPLSLRQDSEIAKIKHRRAASDDKAFFNSGAPRPRLDTTRSSSMIYTPPPVPDTEPPKKSRLRSFSFTKKKKPVLDAPGRESPDSIPRQARIKGESVLATGTLRGEKPSHVRQESSVSISTRTGKVKRFQALRRFFHIKN